MRRLLKFIGWSMGIVLGLTFTTWLWSQFGSMVSAKNSVEVALGLAGYGLILGVWAFAIFTVAAKITKWAIAWQDSDFSCSDEKSCCQNDCGCDRSVCCNCSDGRSSR